ncbi:MAG TPA: sugar transferase [Pirellulales bacterium]|nr:sugar transferase [Pirellulales bacterium]
MEIEFTETEAILDSGIIADVVIDPVRSTLISHTSSASVEVEPWRIDRFAPRTDEVSLEWPLVAPAGNRSLAYLLAKRSIDFVGGLLLLLVLSPILIATLVVLAITTKGNPVFCQQRLGFCGRPFRMYKFRTMVLNALELQAIVTNEQDGPIFKNFADPRITRIGRMLRSFSIDEMPQLLNVVLGQMSLVGPRPPLACEVAQYETWQLQRLAVKPGLTCLWQVSGRSEIGFDQWVEMDLWYLENQSVATDFGLLLRTPWSVVTRRGAC